MGISALRHSSDSLATFDLAFKSVAVLPGVLLPAMMWSLAARLSGRHRSVAVWAVFTLPRPPEPQVRPLAYRPALVVSDFSVKLRRSNEYDYVRLAEEQFTGGWFDVLLARSPERQIDRLRNLEQFGTLILDIYESHDEEQAYNRLRDYARQHTLILLSSEASLFLRIHARLSEFPGARIIERRQEPKGAWLNSDRPHLRLGASEIRRTWREIQKVLNETKVPVSISSSSLDTGIPVSGEIARNRIHIDPGQSSPLELANGIPVIIGTTYHPNWRREGGEEVYAATPFQMLTFVTGPATIAYGRTAFDRAGVWGSIATLVLLCGLAVVPFRSVRTVAASPAEASENLHPIYSSTDLCWRRRR